MVEGKGGHLGAYAVMADLATHFSFMEECGLEEYRKVFLSYLIFAKDRTFAIFAWLKYCIMNKYKVKEVIKMLKDED